MGASGAALARDKGIMCYYRTRIMRGRRAGETGAGPGAPEPHCHARRGSLNSEETPP